MPIQLHTIIEWDEGIISHLNSAIQKENIWIFHLKYEIQAIDLEAKKTLWSLDLKPNVSHPNPIFLDGELIVTTYMENEAKDIGWLFAIHYKTGEIVWKHKISAKPIHSNCSPLFIQDGKVYLLNAVEKGSLLILDSQTGKLLKTFKKNIPELYIYKVLGIVDGDLIVHRHYGPTGRLKISGKSLKVEELGPHSCFGATSLFENQLLLAHKTEESIQFKVMDLASNQAKYEFEYPLNGENFDAYELYWRNATEIMVRLNHEDSWEHSKILMIELSKPQLLWEYENKKGTEAQLHDLYFTEHSILLNYEYDYEQYIAVVNPKDGTFKQSDLRLDSCNNSYKNYLLSYKDYYKDEFGKYATYIYEDKPETISPQLISLPLRSESHLALAKVLPLKDDSPDKIGLKAINNALEQVLKTKKYPKLYEALMRHTGAPSIHKNAKYYIRKTLGIDKIEGPLNFWGIEEALKRLASYKETLEYGPSNQLCPIIPIASETYGHYFYLHLNTGQVIGGHHDSFFVDYVWPVWDSCKRFSKKQRPYSFSEELSLQHGLYDIQQLMKWQMSLKKIGDSSELQEALSPKALVQSLQKAFGWSKNYIKEAFSSRYPLSLMFLCMLYSGGDIRKAIRKQ